MKVGNGEQSEPFPVDFKISFKGKVHYFGVCIFIVICCGE